LRDLEEQVQVEALDMQDLLYYLEHPVRILNKVVKEIRSMAIPFCKVIWSNHTKREAT